MKNIVVKKTSRRDFFKHTLKGCAGLTLPSFVFGNGKNVIPVGIPSMFTENTMFKSAFSVLSNLPVRNLFSNVTIEFFPFKEREKLVHAIRSGAVPAALIPDSFLSLESREEKKIPIKSLVKSISRSLLPKINIVSSRVAVSCDNQSSLKIYSTTPNSYLIESKGYGKIENRENIHPLYIHQQNHLDISSPMATFSFENVAKEIFLYEVPWGLPSSKAEIVVRHDYWDSLSNKTRNMQRETFEHFAMAFEEAFEKSDQAKRKALGVKKWPT